MRESGNFKIFNFFLRKNKISGFFCFFWDFHSPKNKIGYTTPTFDYTISDYPNGPGNLGGIKCSGSNNNIIKENIIARNIPSSPGTSLALGLGTCNNNTFLSESHKKHSILEAPFSGGE